MNYTLNTTIENNVTNYLLCDSNQNYYSISKLLHEILFEYKNTINTKQICENINKKRTENFLTESCIEQGLEKVKAIFFEKSCSTTKNKKYIKHKITIIKEGRLHKTYSLLSFLFNKYCIVFLSLMSIFISIIFFYQKGLTNINVLYNNLIASTSTSNLIVTFLLSLCIVFIHEIGHASATFNNKIQPKEIGLGLYFIFPVLYANVTNIWKLPAKKRLIVNFGGIYFQLIINVFLIVFYSFGFLKDIVLLLLVFNTASILISFNPFFRYDGYWLFSDFFGIANLKEKSTAFITSIINYPNKIKNYIQINTTTPSTIVYSILNIAFWAWVYFSISEYLIKNIPKVGSLIFIKYEFTFQSVSTIFTCILIFVWIFTAVKTIYTTLLKNNRHAKQ